MNRLARTFGLGSPMERIIGDADQAAALRREASDFLAAEDRLLEAEHGPHAQWALAAAAVDGARTRLKQALEEA